MRSQVRILSGALSMMTSGNDRFPRSAIVVIAIGLLATLAVAWVSDEDLITSKPLQWAGSDTEAVPDAEPVAFGEGGKLHLTSTGFDVTAPNSAGYRLFQVGGEVVLDPGTAAGEMRLSCRAETPPPTVNARTPSRPAAFPGPTEDLTEAGWPGDVTIDYNTQGSPYSTVTLPTAYMGYGGEPGTTVEWGDWEAGTQTWIWTVPAERESESVRLRFVSLWRSYERPRISIDCRAEVGGDRARAEVSGSLPG